MKPLLMHPDRDFDPQQSMPPQEPALTQDLELETLLSVMAGEDGFVLGIARRAVLLGLKNDIDTVLYRQNVLKDCLEHPAAIRELYSIALEAVEGKRQYYIPVLRNYPAGTLYAAVSVLQYMLGILKKARVFSDAWSGRFKSGGVAGLIAMLQREFSDEYLAAVEAHLRTAKFKRGVLVSVELGKGNEGGNFVLRQPGGKESGWFRQFFDWQNSKLTYRLADRDEAGARILSEMRDRGINLIANALAQSMEHIVSFFENLRAELAFYIGCLNLHDALAAGGASISFPRPHPIGSRVQHCRALRDASLVLSLKGQVIPNDLRADGKSLVIITGANQGGKSSFLRSVGLAQLMMQSGMFVAAESFDAELCVDLFTHYKREEDATMRRGKLDEELDRISRIVDLAKPNAMVLLNESLASTNEREGSEIARQITSAFVESSIKIFFVTHLYEFALAAASPAAHDHLSLRAERTPEGQRSFKIIEAEPLETSFGDDLYAMVFGD